MRESYFEKNLVADDESDQPYDGQQYEGPFIMVFLNSE
jgi:hypothetical protein